jgi:hypothetical protein
VREDDDDDDAHNDAINDGVRSRMRRNDEDGHGGPRRRGGCGFGFVPALVGIGNVRLGLVAGSSVGAHVGIRSTARHTLHSSAGTAVGSVLYRVPGPVSGVGYVCVCLYTYDVPLWGRGGRVRDCLRRL